MNEIVELINSLNFSSVLWEILCPLFFSCADIISGFIQAIINRDVNSTIMRNGLLHKVLIILLVFLSFIIDLTFSLNFISKAVCIYVIIMEGISIAENITKAGIDITILSNILKIKKGDEK